jgi:hypothetical protein
MVVGLNAKAERRSRGLSAQANVSPIEAVGIGNELAVYRRITRSRR